MRTRFAPILAVLLLALAFGCAKDTKDMQTYKTLAASGVAVDNLGFQAQTVNALFVQRCRDKTLSAKACNDYIAFGEKFKIVYPATVGLWKSSRTVSDVVLQGRVDDIVASLTSELVAFGVTVGYDVVTNLKK
jgi:hypothetical protein